VRAFDESPSVKIGTPTVATIEIGDMTNGAVFAPAPTDVTAGMPFSQ